MSGTAKAVTKVLSALTAILGVAMLVPMGVSLCYGEDFVAKVYGLCGLCCMVLGAAGVFLTPKMDTNSMKMRDTYLIVTLSWLWVSILGAFPFVFAGDIPNYVDAFFESISGYTTTGSTLLFDVEVLSRGGLFWRSFNHWLGGMGIIFAAIVLLPMMGLGGARLIKAEATGPLSSASDFSARTSAIKLYIVYVAITVAMQLSLMAEGLNAYDAAIHMFGALGTGGYSSYNTSIGTFDSAAVDYTVSFFMLLCSINFILVVQLFTGKWRTALRNTELRWFGGIVLFATAFVTLMLWKDRVYDSFADDLRYGFFLVCSLSSSSGYSTGTVGPWPLPCKILLFFLMIIGGCAASTSGGIKVIRFTLLLKLVKRRIQRFFHPRGEYPILIDGERVDEDTVRAVLSYTMAYAVVTLLATILLCCDGADLWTAVTTVVSSLSNIGPDYWFDGRVMCFGLFSWWGKLINAALMLLGRLEFLTIFMLFSPSFRDR